MSLGQSFFAMISQPQNLPTNSIELTTPVLKDAWGNALNFAWSGSSDAVKFPVGLRTKKLVVLIWSSGPNGLNEFGSGDDVYCSVNNAIKENE